jgi:hypothetical protein
LRNICNAACPDPLLWKEEKRRTTAKANEAGGRTGKEEQITKKHKNEREY